MSKDYRKKVITIISAGGVLISYLILRRLTGFSIPCVFRLVTGLKCPGCGVTHMLDSLIKLDIKGAREANPFIFFTSPYLIFELIYEFLLPHKSKTFQRINNYSLILYCIALITFAIFRNRDTGTVLLSHFSITGTWGRFFCPIS